HFPNLGNIYVTDIESIHFLLYTVEYCAGLCNLSICHINHILQISELHPVILLCGFNSQRFMMIIFLLLHNMVSLRAAFNRSVVFALRCTVTAAEEYPYQEEKQVKSHDFMPHHNFSLDLARQTKPRLLIILEVMK